MLGKAQKNKRKFTKFVSGLIITGFLFFANITNAIMYEPGETLDPACLPTDLNCGINPSVTLTTSTYAAGDILFASTTDSFSLLSIGLAGQFLKSTGTSIVWDSIPGGGDMLASNNLSELTNVSTARANLGLVIGTNVQANSARLTEIAGLSFVDGNFIVGNGSGWTVESGATVRSSLGLGNVENTALSTWGGSVNISTVGTVTSGTWQGSPIDTLYLNSSVMLSGENISSLTNDSNFITSSTARTSISENVLGLTYDNVSGILSLDGSYNIPTTASTTAWNNFTTTPSTTISLGTGLVWNSNTIQANTGYEIPLIASTTNWNNIYNTVTASSSDWQSAFSWGNHAGAGYLTSYTESDPIWTAASSTYLATTTAASTYLSQVNAASTYLTQANAVSTYLSLADWNTTTTDALTEGDVNKYYSDTLARNALSFSGLGLTYNSGTGVLSVSSTYNIPTTVSTTAWNNFVTIPSTTIALGTGLAWNNNTIQTNTGYEIPLIASTTNWQSAFSWGNHADANYLTTETDPIWMAASSSYLTTTTAASTYLAMTNIHSSATGVTIQENGSLEYLDLSAPTGINLVTDWYDGNSVFSVSRAGYVMAKGNLNITGTSNLAGLNFTNASGTSVSSTNALFATATTSNFVVLNNITLPANSIDISDTTNLAVTATGLQLSNDNIILDGSYVIPLTVSTTDWQTAFSWGNHAIANYVTTTQATSLAKAAISTSGLALNYDDGVISVASTYNIPTNASTTAWNNFVTTPSTTISLGTGLAWNNNTIQTNTGYEIPLTSSTTNWQTAFSWGNHASVGYLVANSNLSELTNTSTARTNLGLGTLALQNLDGVAITGGSINNTTIGASTPSTAVFTNATSTNLSYSGELDTPFTQGSVLFAGANGVLSENNSGLYFDSATNRLGIGTTTPGYDVEVSGSMRLWESASTTTLVVRAGALQNLSTTPYVFEVLDTTGGRLGGIRIDGYSAAKIFSTADSVSAAISQAGVGYSPGFNLNTSSGIAWASAGQWYAAKDTSISRIAAGKVGIGTGAIGNYSGALLVGSIGINTSTPGYALTIAGVSSATASSIYISPSTDGTSERASLTLDNWEVGQDYNANGSKDFYIKDSASSTSRFFISKDGNIGVGTTTPQSAFHLASGNFTQTVGSDPTIVGGIVGDMKLYETTSVFVSGDYAYITSEYDDSLSILNISDYNNVTTTGYIKDTTNLNAASFVFVSGDYAYVASSLNYSMAIINISNPASPIMVSVIKSTDELSDIRSIHISGNYAYVVDSASNLFSIIDISNPLNPIIVSSIKSSVSTSGATSAYVSGKYAYVTNYVDRSLNIIDISNPTNLSIVGGIEDVVNLDSPRSVYVSGRYAYVINYMGDSFRIIDISNPVAPSIVGGIQDSVNLNDPSSIKVYGNYAYILSKINNSMSIIDISNPAFPSIVADIKDDLLLNTPISLDVSGKRAYILNRYGNLSGSALSIVDLTGVEAPTANIGNIQSNSINVTDNFSVGNDSYLNGGLIVGGNSLFGGGLSMNGNFVQNVGSNPVVISTLSSSTAYSGASDIYVSDNYVYTVNQVGDSFSITDVSDPANPEIISLLASTELNGANGVVVSGKYAYVASMEDKSLRVIDISNPFVPSIVGGIKDNTNLNYISKVAISGNRAYVVNAINYSMRIIDISNPINPILLGAVTSSYFGSTLPQTIYASGNYVYVGTDYGGMGTEFSIIDVSDDYNPVVVGSTGMPFSTVNSIYVSGRYAYIGTSLNDFYIYDLKDVTNILLAGSLSFSSAVSSVLVSGDYSYIKEGNNLHIVDVLDRAVPTLINTTNVGSGKIFLSGKTLYQVANGVLKVIDITGIKAPSANIASIFSNKLNVSENISIGNNAYIGSGLNVGGKSLFNGALSIAGGLTLTDATSTTATTVDLKFNNASTTQWTFYLDKSDNKMYIADNTLGFGVFMDQGDTSWTGISDVRLKENVMDLNVLNRIDNYRAVSFDWKSNGEHDIGAIAQELYEVFPEAVTVGSDEIREGNRGAWGIQYDKLGALALQGVKELKQQLDVYNALLLTGGLNEFVSQTTQSNTLSFSRIVNFSDQVYFSVDNVGSAVILSGENAVRIEFVKEFVTSPIVNLTLASDVTLDTYFVESVDTTGFTIRIRPVQGQDVVINWHAFGQVSNAVNNDNSFVDEEIPESGDIAPSDNLTDLANSYLEDNGLILEDTLDNTNTTTEDVVVETVEDVIIEEIPTTEVSVSSTEENI
ncbi:MAG: tail fiber domain-containing protein [Candidatus Magasanikbacteria bacterium]